MDAIEEIERKGDERREAVGGRREGERQTLLVPIAETRMQRVRDLIEDIRGHLLAVFIEQINLDRPRSQREPFNARVFVPVDAKRQQMANSNPVSSHHVHEGKEDRYKSAADIMPCDIHSIRKMEACRAGKGERVGGWQSTKRVKVAGAARFKTYTTCCSVTSLMFLLT